MATKEKLKTKAARVREEARETGKVILRAPALVRAAECVIRFLLGAMLSGAEIFGGYAPFGLGLVAASGSGLDGFCALLGAVLYGSYDHITGEPRVMVILGCQVMADGDPSVLLQDRLDTALDYLEEHPDKPGALGKTANFVWTAKASHFGRGGIT